MRVFWLEATPWDKDAGAAVTVRACSADIAQIVDFAPGGNLPVLASGPVFDTACFSGQFTGMVDSTLGGIGLASQAGEIDGWARYGWAQRSVKIWTAVVDLSDPITPIWPVARTLIFDGEASDYDPDEAIITLQATRPNGTVAKSSYAGTGGVEGPAGLAKVIKPYAAGSHVNRPSTLVDSSKMLYQVHGYGAIGELTTIRERGMALNQTMVAQSTTTALLAATVPANQIHYHLASGMFRLGFTPIGNISADFIGHKSGSSASRSVSDIVYDLLIASGWSSGKIDTASFNAVETIIPDDAVYYDDVGEDVLGAITRLMLGIGGYWDVDELGMFYIGLVQAQIAGDFSIGDEGLGDYDLAEIDHQPLRIPFWRTRVAYAENPAVMNFSDTEAGATQAQLDMIAAAQATADGKVEVYFQNNAPTGALPDDLWFDTDDQLWYRFVTGPGWTLTRDIGVGQAITAAAGAQATADGKITTFYQTGTPSTTKVGDLWVNTGETPRQVRSWSGSAWVIVSSVGATAGANLYRTDGATVMSQSEVRTPEGTAAGIAGQGALATQSTVGGSQVDPSSITYYNMAMSPGNAVQNSDFATGDFTGMRPYSSPSTQAVVAKATPGVPAGAPSNYVAKFWRLSTGTVSLFLATKAYTDPGADRDGFSVSPGQRWRVSIDLAAESAWDGAVFALYVYFLKDDGTVTSGPVSALGVAAANIPTTWTRFFGGFTVPANTVRAWIYVYAPTMQTVPLYWTNPFAVRVNEEADLSPTAVRLGTNIVRADGSTALTDALAVTSLGTAAALFGQGALATLNMVVGALIAPNSVTNYNLAQAPGNLVQNADFATGDFTAWKPYNWPALLSVVAKGAAGVPANAPSNFVAKIEWTGAARAMGAFTAEKAFSDTGADKDGFAVVPGEVYRVQTIIAKDASFAAASLQISAYFYKNDGTWTSSILVAQTTPGALATATWTPLSGTFTVPTGALRCWLYVHVSTQTAGALFFTNTFADRVRQQLDLTSTAVRLGTNIVRADGLTSLTEALAITSLGTAAAILGQAAIATDATASGRLLGAIRSAGAALPRTFDLRNFDFSVGSGLLGTNNLKDNAVAGYVEMANGRGVEIDSALNAGAVQVGALVDFPVVDGVIYEFESDFEILNHGANGQANVYFYFRVLDKDMNLLTNVTGTGAVNLVANDKRHLVCRVGYNAPSGTTNTNITTANAAFIRVLLLVNRGPGTSSNANAKIRITNFSQNNDVFTGKSVTLFGDRLAANFTYTGGATVQSLQPAQVGANVTGTNISAGFTGQGALATLSAITGALVTPGSITNLNLAASPGNLIQNGDLATGDFTGMRLYQNGGYQAVVAKGTAGVPSGAPANYVARMEYAGTATSLAIFLATQAYEQAGAALEGFAVQPQEVFNVRFWAAKNAGYASSNFNLRVYFLKDDGTFTTTISIASPTLTTSWAEYGGTFTAPAGSIRAWVYILSSSQTAGAVFWTKAYAYRMRGQNDLLSNAVRLGTNIVRADGSTSLTDALAVTSLGTASGIAGQGTLATLNQAAWGSNISGRPTELTDGRVSAGLNSSGDVARALTTTIANSSNLLRFASGGLFTGALNADLTSANTAAGITGQGTFATLSSVTAANFSTYFGNGSIIQAGLSTTAVRIGTNVVRADGSTSVTETLIVTSIGVASAIAGQGALATKGSVDLSTSDVLPRGAIPPIVPDNGFTYTSTTTTVTISWPSMTLYRADGTTVSITSGSQAITGLSATSQYKVYPYIVDNGGSSATIAFVTSAGSPVYGSPAILYPQAGSYLARVQANLLNRVDMNAFGVATPSGGSGGGSGGGWGCVHEDMLIQNARAGDLREGDMIDTPDGMVAVDVIRRHVCSKWIELYSGDDLVAKVTDRHLLYRAIDGSEVAAADVRLGELLRARDSHVEVTGLKLCSQPGTAIGIGIADPHLHFAGQHRLLFHNGTAKP